MQRLKESHLLLRDRILGSEAKQVIDAEFRRIGSPQMGETRRSPLAALKQLFGHIFSGRVAAFGSPSARLRSSGRLRR